MTTITYKDRTLAYTLHGSKTRQSGRPTLMMLSTEYRDTKTVKHFFDHAPEDLDVVVLDNTNMGASSQLDRSLTAEEVIEEIRYVKEALSIERLVLIGYCSNVELAMFCAKAMPDTHLILLSPLVRFPDGGYMEYFYAAMKKAILNEDAFTLSLMLNIVDSHGEAWRTDRTWAMTRQFSTAAALKNSANFWIKTQQSKPIGLFDWNDLKDLDRRVLLLRGVHDTLQPIDWLRAQFIRQEHELLVLDCGHQILNEKLDDVIAHMLRFSGELTKQTVAST